MVLIRHLAAKLFEFNRATLRYFGQIKKPFPAKFKVLQARYIPIAIRMRDYRWLDQLRNKMAFHFDESTYLDHFRSISDDQELSMMAGSMQGETAFLFAEEIVSMPYFSKVGAGDVRKGLEKTADFANRTSSEVLEFYSEFHIQIAKQYGLFRKQKTYEADPASIGTHGENFVPVFTSEPLEIRTRNMAGEFIDKFDELK